MADLIEEHSEKIGRFQPKALAKEFQRILLRELDFDLERRSMETLIENFKDNPALRLPTPYPHMSTRKILTMEKLNGICVSRVGMLKERNFDTRFFAIEGANIFLDMIFRDGVYHADPHPGNIFILPDGCIGLLDCGKVETIDSKTQEQFEDIAYAFVNGDTELLTDEYLRICKSPPDLDREALRSDIGRFVKERLTVDVDQFDMKALICGCLSIIRTHRLIIPPKVNTLFMVLVQLEGTSRILDSSFNLTELLREYERTHERSRYSPERLSSRLLRSYKDWVHLINHFPHDMADLLERLHKGQFNVKINLDGLDRPINRLVCGVIIASLVIGSSMLWANNVPPNVFGFSLLGAMGTLVSFSFALFLLRKIVNSGGLD